MASARTIIIDDRGQLNDNASYGLRDLIRFPMAEQGIIDYAVRNLGFACLVRHPSGVNIRLRPDILSPAAFAALMYWLADNVHARVVLSSFADGWRHEFLGNSVVARRRLIGRLQRTLADRAKDFLSAKIDLRRLRADNPLSSLLRLQSDLRLQTDLERVRVQLDHQLRGRYTIMTMAGETPQVLIERVGYGFDTPTNYWLGRAIGSRVEDAPDAAFGQWASDSYREVLRSGQPALDDVDVIVAWPNVGRRRYTYRRLLLPIGTAAATKGEPPRLLCATLKSPRVDLRQSCR